MVAKAEQQVMLPGIRFVCAAVVLAVSLVIFGMGAAALLRSAHEEFASLPNRRPVPATVFSRQPETVPTLAMLRLEPRDDTRMPEPVASAAATALPLAPPAESPAPPDPVAELAPVAPIIEQPQPEPETTAAIAPVATAPVIEPPSEPGITVAAAPSPASEPAPVVAPETSLAPDTTGSITLPTATIIELPNATLTDEDARLSSSKVAVLGGPPIDTGPVPIPNARPTAEPPKAKPAKKVVKKPAAKRPRVAARAAPATPTAAQQQQDPFGLSQLR